MASTGNGLQVLLICLSVAIPVTVLTEGQEPVCAACPAILIEPQAFSAQERELIREGATRARDFFHAHGVDLKGAIRLGIRTADYGGSLPHIGSYSLQQKTIKLLSLRQSLSHSEASSLFGLPIDRALYKSVVAHEIAHAIADQHFAMPTPSLVAQEYLAYVVQLSTMEPQLREKVLSSYDVLPYQDVEEMSPIYYEMAPSRFGVKAYLHFLTLKNPSVFIHGLLSGAIKPIGWETE
jgi:hypothetical protein